jgi:alkanesulfonate monooxygenase SsuD/methylene tetrahydromethanopterin reductase-like flavin-dependent oxidoreductase (luciferase family)
MAQIADHMADALGVIGTAEACREKVEAFAAAGVDEPIILPFTPQEDAFPAYRQTIAAFSV